MIDHHGAWLPNVTFGLPVLAFFAAVSLAFAAFLTAPPDEAKAAGIPAAEFSGGTE